MSNTECNMLLLKLYDIIISFFIVFWGKKGGGTVHIMKHTRCCMTYWYLRLKFIIGCHRSVMITILAIVSAWIKKWGKYLCDCKYFFFLFWCFLILNQAGNGIVHDRVWGVPLPGSFMFLPNYICVAVQRSRWFLGLGATGEDT